MTIKSSFAVSVRGVRCMLVLHHVSIWRAYPAGRGVYRTVPYGSLVCQIISTFLLHRSVRRQGACVRASECSRIYVEQGVLSLSQGLCACIPATARDGGSCSKW